MKILHIDTGGEMRGGQHQVLLLVKALRERGHQNILLARAGSPLFEATADAGIETWSAGVLQTFMRSKRVDVVHAHDAKGHTLAAAASRCSFVVSRRVAFPIKTSPASKWKYKRAARYLAVSRYVAEQLCRAGVDTGRIDVIYDAVSDVGSGQWDPHAPAVALASHDREKGRDLVTAATKLAGIEVVFSTDIPADLRRASMFVYITRSEGLGSAALVAMSMGIPVIASRVGGLAEVFEDGISGVYTENSVEQIAACMKSIVNGVFPAEAMIANAKRLALTRYSSDQLVEHTLMSYGRAVHA